MTRPQPARTAFAQVTAQWRERSLRTAWLRPGDWWHPTVERVVTSVLADDGVLDAVEALGAARAAHGVGLGETIDDVVALFQTLDEAPPSLEVLRALGEGWASPAGQPFSPATCLDAESGLPTLDYLAVRLAEEYAALRRRGADPAAELHLVLVDVALGALSPWDRMARSAAVGQAVDVALGRAWPAASLGGGMFAVLHRDPVTLADDVARLRAEIDVQGRELGVANLLRQPPRVWVEPLADDHRAAVESLAAWRR